MSNDKIDLIFDLVKEIDRKQDQQNEKLIRLDEHVDRNSDSLDHHIKRTDLLEESVSLQKQAVNKRFEKLEEPRDTIKSLGKLIVWLGSISGGLYAVYRIYNLIPKG